MAEHEIEKMMDLLLSACKKDRALGELLLRGWTNKNGLACCISMMENQAMRSKKKIWMITRPKLLRDDLMVTVKKSWSIFGRKEFKDNYGHEASGGSKKKLHQSDLLAIAYREIDRWEKAHPSTAID
jgi:hypothetical protein